MFQHLDTMSVANSYQTELEESSRRLPERCGNGYRQCQ